MSNTINSERIVELATDVLDQVFSKKLAGVSGMLYAGSLINIASSSGEADFREALLDAYDKLPSSPCHVCAKGALFIAHVLRHDQLTTADAKQLQSNSAQLYSILEYFPKKMLEELEVLFEGRSYEWTGETLTKKEVRELIEFHETYLWSHSPTDRITFLMRALIESKGEKVVL